VRHITHHPVLLSLAASAAVVFAAYGVGTGAPLTVPYLVIVFGLGALALYLDRRVAFSNVVAIGLTAWAIAHLAGGLVQLDDHRVLYNAELLPGVRYDNVVHFVGFGVAGIACWEALSLNLRGCCPAPSMAAWVVWLLGMGVGALNEVVEFGISQIVAESNIGGYVNTGRDLVANLLGAAVAGALVSRRLSVSTTESNHRPGIRETTA
jgi:hypothetical protein